jgi:hypothetical protein
VKNLIGFLGLTAALVLCSAGPARAQGYPSTGWTALTRGGNAITDPTGDVSNHTMDVVGNSTAPAVMITSNANTLFMRIRVDASPNFRNGYACQINVNDFSDMRYDFMVINRTTDSDPGNDIALWSNTNSTNPATPGIVATTLVNDSVGSTGTAAAAGSNFSGNSDRWAMIEVPLSLLGQSNNANPLTLRFVCGTNPHVDGFSNGYPAFPSGSDIAGDETAADGTWGSIMSDGFVCDQTGCRPAHCSSSSQCADPLKPICGSDGKCAACTAGASTTADDAACAAKSSSTPACETDGSCGLCSATNLGGCATGQQCLINTAPTPDTETCVACLQNSDCTDPAAPTCGADHMCHACLLDSGCTGHAGTPACMANGTCSACNVLDEATACPATHLCVVTSNVGTCVPCLDGDVATWSNCPALKPICMSNACVACGTQGDTVACTMKSAAAPVCEGDGSCGVCGQTAGGTNVQGACPDAMPHCQINTGTSPYTETCVAGCGSNSDCTVDPRRTCSTTGPTSGMCVQCDADHACASGVCDVSTGSCVECLLTCASPKVCDPALKSCQDCVSGSVTNGDAHCAAVSPSSPFCVNDMCQAMCASDGQCAAQNPATPVCNGALGNTCTQCTPTKAGQCTNGTPVCNPDTGGCVTCNGDPDCAGSQATPHCLPDKSACVQCVRDGDCSAGFCQADHTCGTIPAPDAGVPDAPVVVQPDAPVVVQPDAPVVAQPDAPVVAQPDAPVVAQPDARVTPTPDAKTVMADARVAGDGGNAADAATGTVNTNTGVVEGGGISCAIGHGGSGGPGVAGLFFLALFAWRSRRRR